MVVECHWSFSTWLCVNNMCVCMNCYECAFVFVCECLCWQRQCWYYVVSERSCMILMCFQVCVGDWIFSTQKKVKKTIQTFEWIEHFHLFIKFISMKMSFIHWNQWNWNGLFLTFSAIRWERIVKKCARNPMTNEVDIRFSVLPLHYIQFKHIQTSTQVMVVVIVSSFIHRLPFSSIFVCLFI